MSYYNLKQYISNSDFSAIKRALAMERTWGDMQSAFDFGSLVDAMVTEPDLLDNESMVLRNHNGIVQFDVTDWTKARLMKEAIDNDDMARHVINMMDKQFVEILDEFPFEYSGFEVWMPVRCKLDGIKKSIKTGMDLKSTSCLNLASFIKTIETWDYDRQAAFYMDVCCLDCFWFFGVSKKPNKKGKHEVFKVAVQRGDAIYESGRAKYQKLGWMYNMLIYSLDFDMVTYAN